MFRELIQLVLQLRRDEKRDGAVLRRRDRTIGHELTHPAGRPYAQLRAWLAQVVDEEDIARAKQAERAGGLVSLVLLVFGLLMGGGTAAAVFFYDGTHPVNILPVLAVFVFLPLLLLVPFVISAIPKIFVQRVPILDNLQESLSLLPAGVIGIVMRLLPQRYRELLQQTIGRGSAHRRMYGILHKWILLRWWQWFVVAFQIGAIAWFGYLIASRDLAFTWSTTLQIEAQQIHGLTDTLATPWSAWLLPSVPGPELIEKTRYFRLGEGILPLEHDLLAQAQKLGRWWPFLLACMVTYGLLPRLLTLLTAMLRCRATVRWSLLHTPGAADVLDRLNNVVIETGSPEPEAETDKQTSSTVQHAQEKETGSGRTCVAVNWSGVPLDERAMIDRIAADLGFAVTHCLDAGGTTPLDDDERVIHEVRDAVTSEASTMGSVVVAVKAWEPPVLEFVDFVHDLRAAVGDGVRIVVAPTFLETAASSSSQGKSYFQQWRQKILTLGDPWLQVRAVDVYSDKHGNTGPTIKETSL